MEEVLAFSNRKGLRLVATLLRPDDGRLCPVVVFAHGWGSSRASLRNRAVAEDLLRAGIASLLLDFSGHGESDGDPGNVTLADQAGDLRDAVDFLAEREELGSIGIAGSSSGAAAAVEEAVGDPRVASLVLRAPSAALRLQDAARLRVPTLLVQSENDPLFERNREITLALTCENRLVTVPGAGHLFEEPGALEGVRRETVSWFRRWLANHTRRAGGDPGVVGLRLEEDDTVAHFRDREAAGRELTRRLGAYRDPRALVLALPRGGVPVAEPIAAALGCDLDVFMSQKLRAPDQPELAIGAVAEGGLVLWNERIVTLLRLGEEEKQWELSRARRELAQRVATYRAAVPRAPIEGRTVIVVDDGVATGATIKAAIAAIHKQGAGRIVVALPGGPRDTLEEIARLRGVHEVVVAAVPPAFYAVGQLYDSFPQVSTEEVVAALRRARERRRASTLPARAG